MELLKLNFYRISDTGYQYGQCFWRHIASRFNVCGNDLSNCVYLGCDLSKKTFQSGNFLIYNKMQKKSISAFDKSKTSAILGVIGCGNPVYQAGVVSVKGGNSLAKNIADSVCIFGSAGRTLCGVTWYTFTTPAGSFFVPDVVIGGKSLDKKPFTKKGSESCKTVLPNAMDSRSSLLVPSSTDSRTLFRSTSERIRSVQSLSRHNVSPKKRAFSGTLTVCRFPKRSAWKSAAFCSLNTAVPVTRKPDALRSLFDRIVSKFQTSMEK